jgi:hypothetical protein
MTPASIDATSAALEPPLVNGQPPAHHRASLAVLCLGALGVVFGDIGTSPLYTLKECLPSAGGAEAPVEHLFGMYLVSDPSSNAIAHGDVRTSFSAVPQHPGEPVVRGQGDRDPRRPLRPRRCR